MRSGSNCWFLVLAVVFALIEISECRKSKKESKSYSAFENLVDQMWDMDENRFETGKDLILNIQGFVLPSHEDNAPEPLFVFVNETRLYEIPTYRAFIDLMKFYDPYVLNVESSSPEKAQSQKKFLDAVMKTKVIKAVQLYLVERKLASSDEGEFKELLGNIWFTALLKKKKESSSPFEHVFLGEGRGSRTLGFHYWLPLYLHEQQGTLNYYGLHSRKRGGLKNIMSVAFNWRNGWLKDRSTFIFGTSPEFEMGIYTAAFLTINSMWPTGYRYTLPLRVKNTRLSVQCYRNNRNTLDSCFIA